MFTVMFTVDYLRLLRHLKGSLIELYLDYYSRINTSKYIMRLFFDSYNNNELTMTMTMTIRVGRWHLPAVFATGIYR